MELVSITHLLSLQIKAVLTNCPVLTLSVLLLLTAAA